MSQMKCAVKKCENRAFMLYGNNFICGNCFNKILEKKKEEKNKDVENLEI